jgi:hypothetical protein
VPVAPATPPAPAATTPTGTTASVMMDWPGAEMVVWDPADFKGFTFSYCGNMVH